MKKKQAGIVCLLVLGAVSKVLAADIAVTKKMDASVGKADFKSAVAALTAGQEADNPAYPEKEAIVLYLDKGLLEHYSGNYAASQDDLQNAERLITEAFTKSVTEGAASYILNDNTKTYPGEDYEDVYLNVFNALNYYNQGKFKDALVEIRKLSESSGKLARLAKKYEGADAKAAKENEGILTKALGVLGGVTVVYPPEAPVNFTDSALAHYLCALFYKANGNASDARIEFDAIQKAYAAAPDVYKNPLPSSIEEDKNVPEGKARLNVIGFTGLSPIKTEQIVAADFSWLQTQRLTGYFLNEFEHPKLKMPTLTAKGRSAGSDKATVTVTGNGFKGTFTLELIENMGGAAIAAFNGKFTSTYKKTFWRTVLKYGSGMAGVKIAADEAKKKAEGKPPALVNAAAQAGAIAAAKLVVAGLDATEGADVRGGRYFPNKALAGGITLDPGTYTVKIAIGKTTITKEIEVKDGSLNLIEAFDIR
ncbi:MAG: hypothetical protein LBG72_00990 [Spirochaetaceae bacterium]|jgi:hypothetical protein|nr:hypothetical protein [Spirochaetaceae bacterium]